MKLTIHVHQAPWLRRTGYTPLVLACRDNFVFLGAFAKSRKATVISLCPSVCLPPWNTAAPSGRIFMKPDTRRFFDNRSRKFNFHSSLTKIASPLNEDLCIFMIICLQFPPRMRNISDKICRENQTTHFTPGCVLDCV